MASTLSSDTVNTEIDDLLLLGKAPNAHEAEEMFLDAHLSDLLRLIAELSDDEFEEHAAIKLLMSHGGRRLEDALR